MTATDQHTASGDVLLDAQNISLTLASQPVLQNVSLRLEAGRIVTLIGPNGAGKTTLIKVLLGLLPFDSGSLTRKKNLKTGYMPQKLQLERTLPMSVSRFLSLARGTSPERIDELLGILTISHLAQRDMTALSGGELQRILLARALAGSPDLLILDEPAQGVDMSGQTELYRKIEAISDTTGCAILMVSHDLHLVMSATDEVICLNHHICCHGKPEHVSNDPAFLELFGRKSAESIAVYTHNHNHVHDIYGSVVKDHKSGNQ